MKRKLLLLALCAILGLSQAKAYTTSDLTSAGWSQVTDLSAVTTLSDYYFMFIDAGTSNYSVTNARPGTDGKPTYQAIQDPVSDVNQVWALSKDGDNYFIQSIVDDWYFISATNSGQGWTDLMATASTNGGFTYTLSDGKYKFKGVFSNGFVGPWNDNGAVNLSQKLHWNALTDDYYEELACNKSDEQAPGFYIFSISRTTYNALRRYSGALENEGWTKVTAAAGLGLAGYYYAFLDLSETGYETGLTMIGTNGRPQYKNLTDPITTTNQLWTTEAHGDGYALKNIGTNTYFFCNGGTDWNTGFTNDINANYTDFILNVTEGKWTLTNSCSQERFVGRWSDSPYKPGDSENIAANKQADAGKRQFFIYSIPTIAGVATELPANGDMVADKWYYIDIAAAADNYTATATTLGDIVYTTDGTTLVRGASTVTDNFSATDNSLSAVRYYVKSSSANNLVIGVASYTYTVGTPTFSIADGNYTNNSLSTFTFNFSEASTNDPEASFAILNGSAKASLKKAGEEKAQGTLSLDGKVLTATFSDVTLDLSSTYTIEIAADVVGYEGQETNAAISTSIKTGIIANGVYYFKRNDTDAFLTRGGNYGTENVTDKFGISFEAAIQNDGTYTLKNIDQSLVDNTTKYLNEQYTDQTGAYKWTIESAEGGYVLKKSSGQYVTTTEEGTWHYNYMSNAADKASAIVWTLLSKSEYAAALTARKNAEAAAIATAAGRSETTEAALISALATDFGETDMTSSLTNASLASNADGWTAVSYNSQRRNQADEVDVIRFNGGAEVWSYIGGAKQTVSSLPEGIYKVTVKSIWRLADSAGAGRAGNEANVTAWMYATSKGVTDYTQLKSWYEHQVANNAALHASTNDEYVNAVYVYVEDGQDLTIGLASPSWCGVPWMPFYDFTLTYYEAKATDGEKEALADAITAAEAKTLGFETGEYAPYNNIAALEKLTAAKAINPATASGKDVVAATTALTGATWVANVGEVNAISWIGSDYTDNTDSQTPLGWTDGNGGTIRISANYGSNSGLNSLDPKMVLNLQAATAYGETGGYTLPLNATTQYKLSFKYAGWGQTSGEPTITITDPSGTSVGSKKLEAAAQNHDGSGEWVSVVIPFTSTTAGNYKVAIALDGGRPAFGEFNLVKVPTITIAETDEAAPTANNYANVTLTRTLSASYWNTFSSPVNIADLEAVFGTGVSVTELDEENTTGNQLAFKTASSIVAGKPYLVKPLANVVDPTINGVAVIATAGETVTGSNGFKFIGTVPQITLSAAGESSTLNYFLNTSGKLVQPSAEGSLKGMRAYFNVPASVVGSSVKLFINGLETAIESIDGADAQQGTIFNLAGQRVNKAQKGVYIVNGKKVTVK